jgi:glyoxylase-like metal-dependent hydrolase (beta-lactamase superfamily II)
MPEVAPRIRTIGEDVVNAYLVEADGEVTIVDAGVPAYWDSLPRELAAIGRTIDDVRAVLLTHGHSDHIGFAERARRAGIPLSIHELDAALARSEVPNPAKGLGPAKLGPLLWFLWFSARRGALRIPKITSVGTFGDGATLDVPGAPRVIHVPGHTPGSAALHFAAHDALFVGDALATYAVTNGGRGPQIPPFTADREEALRSLDRLSEVPASLVLPGHGGPWREGARGAVEAARAHEAAGRPAG